MSMQGNYTAAITKVAITKVKDAVNAFRKDYRSAREICKACPSSVKTKGAGLTCGVFLHDGSKDTPPTCGCKISWKTFLKELFNTRCPQKKW